MRGGKEDGKAGLVGGMGDGPGEKGTGLVAMRIVGLIECECRLTVNGITFLSHLPFFYIRIEWVQGQGQGSSSALDG